MSDSGRVTSRQSGCPGWVGSTTWIGLLTASAALLAFAVVVAWRVPWAPVPGGMPPAAAAQEAFTGAQIAVGEHYSAWARTWSLTSLGLGLVVACVLGFSRWGRLLVQRMPGAWPVQVLLSVAGCVLIGRLVTLPLAVCLRQLRLRHGLTTQDWAGWTQDLVIGEMVSIAASTLVLLVLLALAARWRRAWPAVGGVIAGLLVVLGSYAYPLIVEPLFNSFEPLPDGKLRDAVLTVAAKQHVEIDEVLVADASRRTTSLNAYVSGLASSRRVVLYDTLVDSLPQDEAVSVVAHELAHARHDDVLTGTLLGAFGAAAGVGLLGVVLSSQRERLGPNRVPLVLALVAVVTVATAPVQSAISRQLEIRADVDALQTTGKGEPFVIMQQTLTLRALADPTSPAVTQWWWGTHPTVLQRIAIAQQLTGVTVRPLMQSPGQN